MYVWQSGERISFGGLNSTSEAKSLWVRISAVLIIMEITVVEHPSTKHGLGNTVFGIFWGRGDTASYDAGNDTELHL